MPPNIGDKATGSVDALVSHPELFKAYPDLKGLRLDLTKTKHGIEEGGYLPPRGKVPARFEVEAPNYAGGRSVAAHELQHGVQNIEGFATGGMPEQFIPHFEKIMRNSDVPVYD